jgi:hypothetical protein
MTFIEIIPGLLDGKSYSLEGLEEDFHVAIVANPDYGYPVLLFFSKNKNLKPFSFEVCESDLSTKDWVEVFCEIN